MDDVTTAATLVILDQPELAEQWFATICQTYDEVSESDDVWAGFVEGFPPAADAYFGSSTATQWVEGMEDLTTDPAGLLAQLAAQRDDLASLYWAETQPEEAAAEEVVGEAEEDAQDEYAPAVEDAEPADPFAWVHAQPELVARVQSTLQYWPEHYESHLRPYLEGLWGPGWEQHPDEHKQAWLDQALAGLETAEAETDSAAQTGETGETASTEETGEPAATEEAGELAEVEQQVADALAEALAEVPEAAALSDEEIAEVLAEVLAEQSETESV